MSLRDQLADDLKTAMKAHDAVKTSVLRMLRAKIQDAELALRAKQKDPEATLPDDQVTDAIAGYAKQLRESIEQFDGAGRQEQAAASRAELAIVEAYLPAQLTDEEITQIVQAAVAETGASSMRDMGKVMSAVMPQVKGKADGKRVNAIVKAALTGG